MGIHFALLDHDTNTDRALLADVCEMVSDVGTRLFGLPPPYGHGVEVTMRLAAHALDVAPGETLMTLEHVPTVDGAEGFHEDEGGVPTATIYPSLLEHIEDLAGVVPHEAFEEAADPTCMATEIGVRGTERRREVCDAVEAETWEYTCRSGRKLRCTNWVLPPWFSGGAGPHGLKLDHMGTCTTEGELREGGYIDVMGLSGWRSIVNGEKRPYRARLDAHKLTRKHRREKASAR